MNLDGVLATYSRVKPHVPAAVPRNKHFPGAIRAYSPQHPQEGSRLLTANPNIYAGNEAHRHKYFMLRHFSNSGRAQVRNIREKERNIQWNTILESSFVFVPSQPIPFSLPESMALRSLGTHQTLLQ